MPQKKRRNSSNKSSKEENESKPRQATPDLAAQGSTAKPAQPAQFEKASSESAMATKPGVVIKETGAGVKAGSAAVGTAGKETPKTKPESTTATTTVKADVPKVDAAKTSKPAATAAAGNVPGKKEEAKVSKTKVQAEVPSTAKGTKKAPAEDPIDALASILPPSDPVTDPVYTGPAVSEHHITAERTQKCGEREDTLPPGYRFTDMTPAPADVKPKDVPKPMTTDEAMESLLDDFSTPTAPTKDHVDSVSASSAGPVNFAPPPVKKGDTAPVVSPAPPADKKAKMEKAPGDSSLKAGQSAPSTKSAPAVAVCYASAERKAMVGVGTKVDTKVDTKHKADKSDPMSPDPFSALGDLLPKDAPKPEAPKLRPEDIVSEDKAKKEKGVLVGERDDTLPPEYRFTGDEHKKGPPPPKPVPSMDEDEALDILGGSFDTSPAPPVVPHSAAPAQKAPAPPPVAVPPADKKTKKDNISVEAGLSASTAKKVESCAVPPVAVCPAPPVHKKGDAEKTAAAAKDKKPQVDPMSLDALSALGDTLPKDAPKPEAPKLRPEDIVSEDKAKKEKGVRVGEREDTLPPEYRFTGDGHKNLPPLAPEPSMDPDDALDFLSEGFETSSSAPAVQSPSQTKVEDLSALDVLSGEFVAPTKASGVQKTCPVEKPSSAGVTHAPPQHGKPKIEKEDSLSLDALSALSDTLPADAPKPELPKLRPEDIVAEDKLKKEKGVLVGVREDTLPPEYRYKGDKNKNLPPQTPEPTMETNEALDILSGGFTTSTDAAAQLSADFVAPTAASKVQSAACVPTETGSQLAAGADNALDALSDTLKDITPTPKPVQVPAKDIVKEKKAVEEKVTKMGEKDDTLPPEYRTSEADLKKMKEEMAKKPAGPKEKPMDDNTALDLLSGDFSAPPSTTVQSSTSKTKLESPAHHSGPMKGKSKSKSKSKKHQAEQPPATNKASAQLSSDVAVAPTKKGGKS